MNPTIAYGVVPRGGWLSGGVNLYLGVTRSGKTTLAIQHCQTQAQKSGLPVVVLDLEEASQWLDEPHAANADEVLHALYVERRWPRVWTPHGERERAKFFMAVRYWGGAHILIDGLGMICEPQQKLEPEFRTAILKWGHGRLGPTAYYMVAQRAAMLHRTVYAAANAAYIFKLAPGADADRIAHEYGIPVERSTHFKRGEHEPIILGFEP